MFVGFMRQTDGVKVLKSPAPFYGSNSKSCSQEPRVAGATPACHTNKMLAVAQAAEQRCMQTSRVDFNALNRCRADSTASKGVLDMQYSAVIDSVD